MSNEQKRTTGPRRQTPGPWLSKEIAWQYDGSHALVWCDKSKGGGHWRRLDEQCNGRFSAPDARLLAAAPKLLKALCMWMDIHKTPAGFAGKYGKELDAAIAAHQLRIDAAVSMSLEAITQATGATHE